MARMAEGMALAFTFVVARGSGPSAVVLEETDESCRMQVR